MSTALKARFPHVAASILLTAAGCEAEQLDCQDARTIGSLRLRDDGAGVTPPCQEGVSGLHVDGNLWVEGTSLERLDLSCICSVSSLIVTDNPRLLNLSGLESVRKIRGGLRIVNNESLAMLPTLSEHASIGEFDGYSIFVDNNDSLLSLAGLPKGVQRLGGSVHIANNRNLETLDGFPLSNVDIAGGVRIESNDSLRSLAGLPPSVRTLEYLIISGNPRLEGLEGLPSSLEQVKGALWVTRNPSLLHLSGVPPSLSSVGEVYIQSNDSLVDLSGFSENFEIRTQLTISHNNALQNLGGLPEALSIGKSEWDGVSLRVLRNDNMSSLSGLPSSLQSVPGGVVVSRMPVESLEGLFEHLREVQGLELVDNPRLRDLSGIPDGTRLGRGTLGWSLFLVNNDSMETLSGFPSSLSEVPGGVSIVDNDLLVDLTGMEGVLSIDGDLYIGKRYPSNIADPCDWSIQRGGNLNLHSLKGLSSIVKVSGSLVIACNESLLSLDAFENLREVNGSLLLLDNEGLADLAGLGGASGTLQTVDGTYGVRCSPQLDLEAVQAVTSGVIPQPVTSFELGCS